MYNLQISTKHREDIIRLGETMGTYFKENPMDRDKDTPWVVSLGADSDSGKSLVALAIDRAFRPHLYQNGIGEDVSADERLKPSSWGPPVPVVFKNFQNFIHRGQESFDTAIGDFIGRYNSARVYVCANIQRTFMGEFNYAANGLSSKWLDANLHVYGHKKNGFLRRIATTVKNEELFNALQNCGLDFQHI